MDENELEMYEDMIYTQLKQEEEWLVAQDLLEELVFEED